MPTGPSENEPLTPQRLHNAWREEHGSLEALNETLGIWLLDDILAAPQGALWGDLVHRYAEFVIPDDTVVCRYDDPSLRPFAILYSAMFAAWRRHQVDQLVKAGATPDEAEVEVALGGGEPLPERLRYQWKWLYGTDWA